MLRYIAIRALSLSPQPRRGERGDLCRDPGRSGGSGQPSCWASTRARDTVAALRDGAGVGRDASPEATSPGSLACCKGDLGTVLHLPCPGCRVGGGSAQSLGTAGGLRAGALHADRTAPWGCSPPHAGAGPSTTASWAARSSVSPSRTSGSRCCSCCFFAVTLRWFSAGGFPGWDDPVARRSSP
jgi:hypothetical protein